MNGEPINWSSKKQPTVTASSTEAEYIACFGAAKDISWLNQMLKELGFTTSGNITLYCDNMSTIKLINNPVMHQRPRHIDIKYHYIREKVKDGTISIQHMPTTDQVADILTKPLPKGSFQKLRDSMNVHQLTSTKD
jgi:hypothetical protein